MLWDSTYAASDTEVLPHMENQRTDAEHESIYIGRDEAMVISPNSKYQDLSMYQIESPAKMSCDNSPVAGFTVRRPSDEYSIDSNSQDSGFSVGDSNRFASPKSNKLSFLSSIDEEGFVDLSEFDVENETCADEDEDDEENLPGDFRKLIEKPLTQKETSPVGFIRTRPPFRRALSLFSDFNVPDSPINTPKTNKDENAANFKRPEPPSEIISPVTTKRSKQETTRGLLKRVNAKPIFGRSLSDGAAIISAIQRSSAEPDLIGDFSKPYSLPLIQGRHRDLKSISATTLAQLIRGNYYDSIASFKIIDCRYPYEYHGGHIVGADNLYNRDQIINELLNVQINKQEKEKTAQDADKRHIVVFHCEFSSERGPNLFRYLRNIDRSQNKDFYPFLHFPEVYLLDGGYKSFYENYAELCDPSGYLPMLHPDHEDNLRHFRSKAKTWNCDSKRFNKKMSNPRI